MYGNSMGAFLTIVVAQEYDGFRVAGITAGGVREGGDPPAERVGEIDAPFSIHHGTADTTVPIRLARTFRDYLSAAGIEHAYYEYEGVGHNLWQVQSDLVFSRMIAFFNQYTSPGGAPGAGGSPGGGGAAPFGDPADAISVFLALPTEVAPNARLESGPYSY